MAMIKMLTRSIPSLTRGVINDLGVTPTLIRATFVAESVALVGESAYAN